MKLREGADSGNQDIIKIFRPQVGDAHTQKFLKISVMKVCSNALLSSADLFIYLFLQQWEQTKCKEHIKTDCKAPFLKCEQNQKRKSTTSDGRGDMIPTSRHSESYRNKEILTYK